MSTNIFQFEDVGFTKDIVHPYSKNKFRESVIVIDNGSHSCRAGWSTDSKPRLVFRNLVAKLRGKKESDPGRVFFGNDIEELEDLKWNIRTQFDMDAVSHFDTQESAFDYLFTHLGINTTGAIDHPVCITEAVCIPNTMRHYMSELLFECYNVSGLVYGVDALFSWKHNMLPTPECSRRDGLIVSCGYQTSHVLPIVDGKFDIGNSRRLNLGGLNMMIYLRRLLQLRHPSQAGALNLSRAQELLIGHSYVATDYIDELKRWQDVSMINERGLSIQLPVVSTTTEKELEMRKLQAIRLKEINQKKREEKIKNDQEQLKKFTEIKELESSNHSMFKVRLKQEGFKKDVDLDAVIKELNEKLCDRREKSRLYLLGQHDTPTNEVLSLEEVELLLSNLEDEKLNLLDKRRSRNSRKQALNKRKSYASKERMRILSQLAKSSNTNQKSQKEDTFGMKDEDWDVYKYINKDNSESEDEQDQERLNEIEQSLSQYQLTMNKLMIGRGQIYQYLPFNTEQIQVPEVMYQPSMLGIEQEGFSGMIEYVLKNYDADTRDRMIQNILCYGGPTQLPGFKQRLETELMALLPFRSNFRVHESKDGLLDSWHGAVDFLRESRDLSSIMMSREEYDEQGVGYFKEHMYSNVYVELADD